MWQLAPVYPIVIIVIIITIIFVKNSNNKILLKKKKKKIFAFLPKVTLVGTGFESGTVEFPTYLSNYVTRPNDLGCSDYLCMSDVRAFNCI